MTSQEQFIIRNYIPTKIIQVPVIESTDDVFNLCYEAEPNAEKVFIASEIVDIINKLNLKPKNTEDSTYLAKLLLDACNYFDRPLVGLCNVYPMITTDEEFRKYYQADAIITILRVAKLI